MVEIDIFTYYSFVPGVKCIICKCISPNQNKWWKKGLNLTQQISIKFKSMAKSWLLGKLCLSVCILYCWILLDYTVLFYVYFWISLLSQNVHDITILLKISFGILVIAIACIFTVNHGKFTCYEAICTK